MCIKSIRSAAQRIRGVALVCFSLAALTVVSIAVPVAQAHDTDHCYHGNIYNGGWTDIYDFHFWSGTVHYNVYSHHLYGTWQHDEYNVCN